MASSITERQTEKISPLVKTDNATPAVFLLSNQNLKLINPLSLTSTNKKLKEQRNAINNICSNVTGNIICFLQQINSKEKRYGWRGNLKEI